MILPPRCHFLMTSQQYSASASIAMVSYMAGGSSVGLATSLLNGCMQEP